jgi:hypothetical protein
MSKAEDFATVGIDGAPSADFAKLDLEYFGRVTECFDIDRLRWLAAGVSSCEYVTENMRGALRFADWNEQYRYLLSLVPQNLRDEGLFLEFGVHSGATINSIAVQTKDKTIFGFDSFEGLPDDWHSGIPSGVFNENGIGPKVEDNVELVVGWFDKTLPFFLDKHEGEKAAFIHVDCDIYSSTVMIFNGLRKQIVPGTVILFDEYFNYPEWQHHEHKALLEFCKTWNVSYKYVCFMPQYMKAAIQIIDRTF